MSKFCERCGAAITGTDAFCTTCGARNDIVSGANTPLRTPARPVMPATRFSKKLIAAAVVVLFFAAMITTGIIYVAYRVKQKAAELASSSETQTTVNGKGDAENGAQTPYPGSPPANSSDNSSPNCSSDISGAVGQTLDKLGIVTNGTTQNSNQAGTPEDQAKSLADAALVSQALLRNLNHSPAAIPPAELPAGTAL